MIFFVLNAACFSLSEYTDIIRFIISNTGSNVYYSTFDAFCKTICGKNCVYGHFYAF